MRVGSAPCKCTLCCGSCPVGLLQTLFHRTGCLNIGDPACSAALASARTHNLPHELLSGADINQRFPGDTGSLTRCACMCFAMGACPSTRS
jgi:hypothetical protein